MQIGNARHVEQVAAPLECLNKDAFDGATRQLKVQMGSKDPHCCAHGRVTTVRSSTIREVDRSVCALLDLRLHVIVGASELVIEV